MSLIYAGGVRATAITNIKAAINARIVVLSDGTKDLNRESLTQWLQEQFNQMKTDGEAVNEVAVAQAVNQTAAALVAELNLAVRKERFMADPNWPRPQTTSDVGAAVRTGLAELKSLADAVTAHYADTEQRVVRTIEEYFDANGVISGIPAGVQRLIEARSYIYTYVNDWGEESAPSPACAVIELDQNDTVTVEIGAVPTGRNITHWRLYRANSSSTSAAFQLVPNPDDDQGFPVASLSVLDDTLAADLQEPCPSLTWEEPPSDLRGLVAMGNGIMVGYTGNTVCPCEPYKPYAFPPDYQKTTSHPIVGLCAVDQILVVGTQGAPKILAGSDSASLSEIRHNSGQACVSARSMVATPIGVIYASPDGLVAVNSSGVRLITGPEGFNLFTREDWQEFGPSGIFATEHEGCYIFHSTAKGKCYSLDLQSGRLLEIAATGSAFYRDQLTDTLYLAQGTTIKALFTDAARMTATWRSKLMELPATTYFAWLQANADYASPVTVKLYRAGALFHTATLTSAEPVRLPPGRHTDWEVEVTGTQRVRTVTVASSADELKSV